MEEYCFNNGLILDNCTIVSNQIPNKRLNQFIEGQF